MPFTLPFENEIRAADQQLAKLPADGPVRVELLERLARLEREVYPNLDPYETFLLSGHPLRPKALDYVRYIFRDVRLFWNPKVHGDHLMIGGEGRIEIDGRLTDVMFVGQQTGPSSQREHLIRLPGSEYQRWNQGMGFPSGYRKAVYCMELAERRGWPVVVFVDTPGADPSEFSEEQGQAFAINEVIHKTTALRTPSLSYIISLGASGGAIAITPTNRTIINEYATYMVISPGGCASILFRNRSPESIRQAAEDLHLTSGDALRQGTVDDVVGEGARPGHRYPQELLEAGRQAVARNLAEIAELRGVAAEDARRAKFFAQGVWGESKKLRKPDALARQAVEQSACYTRLKTVLAEYLARESGPEAVGGAPANEDARLSQVWSRVRVARAIYAVEHADSDFLKKTLGADSAALSRNQWRRLREFALSQRYGHADGAVSLHPNGGMTPYRRLHPVDSIRLLTDEDTFREFEETIGYCSIDQLGFPKYEAAVVRGSEKTGLESGLITGTARIGGHAVVLAINNFGLVGSSLCDEIGEKMRYAAHHALEVGVPLVTLAMGGGARMQEGTPSMHRNIPKAQHALNELEEAGVPHISIIADPTLGGTAISYGLRGDYMIVIEGSANVGFSGKRVVEQFQERKVAADFQHETWLMRRGFVDECVRTDHLASRLAELLQHHADGKPLADLRTRELRRWEPSEETPLTDTVVDATTVDAKLVAGDLQGKDGVPPDPFSPPTRPRVTSGPSQTHRRSKATNASSRK